MCVAYPFGLLNTVWLKHFQESETRTSWIGSIFYAVPLLTGPIASKLIDRFGCRQMVIAGGFLSAFGFAMSSICQSIEQLYITIGIIGGIGLSSAYIVGLLSVERWFESKRSLAIGIVSAGTGFGTFIFAPITQFSLDNSDWRKTMIYLSGALLIVCLCGLFLIDPKWKIHEDKLKTIKHLPLKSMKSSSFVDFSFFRDRNFLLLGLSTFVIYALYPIPMYYMTELLSPHGYAERDSAQFISLIGFFLTFGMIGLGWLTDRSYCKEHVVTANAICVFCK